MLFRKAAADYENMKQVKGTADSEGADPGGACRQGGAVQGVYLPAGTGSDFSVNRHACGHPAGAGDGPE